MKRFLIVAGFCAFALPALAQTTKFQAQISGSEEVPAKQSNGKGTADRHAERQHARIQRRV